MKLDKIGFARLIALITREYKYIHHDFVQAVDDCVNIDVPNPEVQTVYPKNENVERLMMLMAEGTRKIDAIKEHRAITGMGLKESKDAVDRYWPDGSKKLFSVADLRSKLNTAWDSDKYCVIEAFIANL